LSVNQEITYELDFCAGRQGRKNKTSSAAQEPPSGHATIPRIARLMALAIRFEGLVRKETVSDHAELARLGRVTRARMTQITKLLDLAPDLQEQLLFLPPRKGLNEKNLRSVVRVIEWRQQRLLFQEILNRAHAHPSPFRI
jgi:hypothetical protein